MTTSFSGAAKPTSQQITLETPRLILRAAQPSDATPLFEAFKDPEVMRYWYVIDPTRSNRIDGEAH